VLTVQTNYQLIDTLHQSVAQTILILMISMDNGLFNLENMELQSIRLLRHESVFTKAITLEKDKNQLNINYDGSYNLLQVMLYPSITATITY
jgi:hypothetical protein